MNLPVAVRRLAAVVLPAALLAAGAPLLGGVASANHSVITVNPAGSVNNVTPNVDIYGSGFSPLTAEVRLRRTGLGEGDVVTGDVVEQQSESTRLRATFNLDLANPGTYDVVVRQLTDLNNIDRVCVQCFTVSPIANPTVSSVVAADSGLGNLAVNGTNFAKSSTVEFWVGGNRDNALTWTPTGTNTATRITGTYTPGGGLVPGLHDLRVVNTDGSSGSCSNCFLQPKIDNLSRTSVGQGAQNVAVVVNGDALTGGTVSVSGSGVTVNSQNVVSDEQIAVNLSVAGNAAATARTLTVRHPNGGYHSAAFSITAAPTVSGVSPSSRGQGAAGNLTLTGSNFVPGMTVAISPNTGVQITGVTVNNAGNATVAYQIAQDAATGARSIVVANPDLGASTASNAFTINTGPKITKVIPSALNPNTNANPVQIQGTGFDSSVSIDWGAGITQVGPATVSNGGTLIDAIVNVASNAPGGLRAITVQNSGDGGRGTCQAPGCLGINTLTIASGGTQFNNGVKTIVVNKSGGGLELGSTVELVRNGTVAGQGAIPGTVTGVNGGGTQLTFTVDLNRVAPGAYSVNVVTNGDADSCVACITVSGGTPSITTVSPDDVGKGADDHTISLVGANFANGATIEFTRGLVAENNITVVPGSVVVHSLTSMEFKVDVAPGTTDGAVSVTVNNPGDPTGQSGGCSNCLTVVPAPTLAGSGAISPNSRGQGAQQITVTITGTNFDTDGVDVDFGPDVDTGTPVVTDGGPLGNDTIQIPVTVDLAAATGARNVVVVNDDGGRVTCTGCFTVTPAPSVGSISPSFGKAGQQVDVTITGANFGGPAPQPSINAGPDITVSNVNRTSPTQILARFTIGASPTLGARDVQVTNPDGGRGTGFNAFSVVTVPGAPTIGSATAGNQSATVSWTAPASTGGTSITGYEIACEPSCGTVSVPDGAATQGTVTDLTNGVNYRLKVRALNAAGPGPYSALSAAVLPIGPDGDYVALPPKRLLDTRLVNNPATTGKPLAPGQTLEFRVTGGSTTVPTAGVSAVALNVTAVKPTATSGHLRVFPTGSPVPTASTLNFTRGVTVPNLVKVRVGTGGKVSVFNSSGQTHLLLDVVGYFLDGTTGSGLKLTGVTPERVLDTRNGTNSVDAPIGAVGTRTVDIADGTPIPEDADAVVLNVAVTQPQRGGYLTVWPGGGTRPVVSNLNYVANQTIANLVVVKLGTGANEGKISLYNGSQGTIEVLADVVGFYKSSGGGQQFKGLTPVRILDTRSSTAVPAQGAGRDVLVRGVGNVPDNPAVKAVVVNVTVVSPSSSGFLTVYPKGESRPLASNVNFVRGQTIANLAVLKVGADGKVTIYSGTPLSTHVLFDVVGYYV